MALPKISGEFGVVFDPEMKFSNDGRPWVKIRGVSKDRRKNDSGEWEDGEACFIDILIGGKPAENIVESVVKGDVILVHGSLHMKEWEKDGVKMKDYSIRADEVGVSTRFEPARTRRSIESMGGAVAHKAEAAAPAADDELPPF